MEMVVYIIIGVVGGFAVAWLWRNGELVKAQESAKQAAKTLEEEQARFAEKLQTEQNRFAEKLSEEQKRAEEKVQAERQHSQELRAEMEKQQEAKGKLLQEEFRNMATQMLSDSRKELNAADKERLDALLNPLKERIDAFQKTVQDNSKEGAQHKTEIKSTFEAAMKMLHEEQERTVRQMREDSERTVKELKEQTQRIGDDAASLTRALKGDSKLQGDWGEMILELSLIHI